MRLEVDGYTDSVGSDEYNQQLSEKARGVGSRLSCATKHCTHIDHGDGILEDATCSVE